VADISARGGTRPAWVSWLVLGLALAVLGVTGSVLALTVSSQANTQAVRSAEKLGDYVVDLTARRALNGGNVRAGLAKPVVADLDEDVRQLGPEEVLGLEIWSGEGARLYQRGLAGPLAPRSVLFGRAVEGSVEVRFLPKTATSPSAVDVLVPLGAGHGGGARAVASVVLPADWVVGNANWATDRILAAIIAMLVLAATALLVLQLRLRQRSYQAGHDAMTGLGNRALLECVATTALCRHDDVGLVVMDLDGFKRVNDALGHAAGDEMLVQVAKVLKAAVRPDDLLVRLGGDEFAVLLHHVDAATASACASRLLSAVRVRFVVRGVSIDGDASVGVAVGPEDGTTFAQLVQSADIAMSTAKRGKLGVCSFAEGGGEVEAGKLNLLVELQRAITDGELRLHYQPAVSLKVGAGAYVEALVRWQHPQRGLLFPDIFVPLAEETAIIHPMTEWVLDEAVRQCAQWRLDGLEINVAVNISPRSLTRPGLFELVRATLARHQLPAAALTLEVTESAVIARPDLARDILAQLHSLGITISIDDFGVGYTSLTHLKTLPVGTLKIDKSFVQDLLTDPDDRAIVASVIILGHNLGMEVVAEGVEDRQTLEHLSVLGCDLVQGFYLSKPLPPRELTSWLLTNYDPVLVAVADLTGAHGGEFLT
jgi:diguanylate cyclase (GGDEF)-like protein